MQKIEVKNHKKLKNSRHKFEVQIPLESMLEYFDKAYKVLAPSVEIKGFRPGQAPKALIIDRIGQERYLQTAMDYALPESYTEAVKELKITPIAPPQISIQSYGEATALVYDVEVDVLPEVDAGDYKKVRVKAPKKDTKVTAKDIADVLTKLRRQQAQVKPVERAAKVGDSIEIDFIGSIGGVQKDQYSSKNYPLIIGDNAIEKTIEDSLVGKKKGDTYKLTAKIDKEKVDFEITVHSVGEIELPEVNADFAKQFGRNDAKDLEQAIESQLSSEKEEKYRLDLEDEVVKAVLKGAKTQLPESLIEEEISRRVDNIKQQLGAVYDQFLQSQKKTEDDLRKEARTQAEESVKAGLVLGEITKREGFGKDLSPELDDETKQRMAVRKTIDFLVESATKSAKNSEKKTTK